MRFRQRSESPRKVVTPRAANPDPMLVQRMWSAHRLPLFWGKPGHLHGGAVHRGRVLCVISYIFVCIDTRQGSGDCQEPPKEDHPLGCEARAAPPPQDQAEYFQHQAHHENAQREVDHDHVDVGADQVLSAVESTADVAAARSTNTRAPWN